MIFSVDGFVLRWSIEPRQIYACAWTKKKYFTTHFYLWLTVCFRRYTQSRPLFLCLILYLVSLVCYCSLLTEIVKCLSALVRLNYTQILVVSFLSLKGLFIDVKSLLLAHTNSTLCYSITHTHTFSTVVDNFRRKLLLSTVQSYGWRKEKNHRYTHAHVFNYILYRDCHCLPF